MKKKESMRAAAMEEEPEQKICHSGESIRDAAQKTACPRPDPGVQLGVGGQIYGGRSRLEREEPEGASR